MRVMCRQSTLAMPTLAWFDHGRHGGLLTHAASLQGGHDEVYLVMIIIGMLYFFIPLIPSSIQFAKTEYI
jgi:hypothetical protein